MKARRITMRHGAAAAATGIAILGGMTVAAPAHAGTTARGSSTPAPAADVSPSAVAMFAVAGTPDFVHNIIYCVSTTGARACFQPYGDKLWVKGRAASADWENYLRDRTGAWKWYRTGSCLNKLSGGRWGYCQVNFYEDTSKNPYGGKGSGIRLQALGRFVWISRSLVWACR
ncbi:MULTISPECIES: hypothetical protein [Streptomyces]|uniref:hypothetical protein n=1 Tax=Streptomyces TaxID=1883 RepID=UPI00160086DB|nr:hypothetical protein [Streptomyces murinus]MBA9050576.1 hypothetical protein [Streptomyces murinus]